MTTLRVYQGVGINPTTGKPCFVLIASDTCKAAWKAINGKGYTTTYQQMVKHWDTPTRPDLIELAKANPGVVYQTSNCQANDYQPA